MKKLVQIVAMAENFVKNFLMVAKIDPRKPRLSGSQTRKNEEDSGNDNDGYFPEDLVSIASPDWCRGSWHNQSPC